MNDPCDSQSSGLSPADSVDDDVSMSSTPPYAPDELAGIFLDFYTFLTTLHYDAEDLKTPPPGGWPGLTRESCSGFKSDYAIEVLRRLPYFDSEVAIHHKSRLIDYTSLDPEYFIQADSREEYIEFCSINGDVDPADVFFIAWGHESYGRELLLNVKHGEIIEEVIRVDQLGPYDVSSYFDSLKESYRNLKLIPCSGRVTIEAEDVEERVDQIRVEQVRAQTESWGTDLDIQYIRQLYRQHGWPQAFRKDDARKAVDELMDSMEEQRGGWEEDSFD